MVGCNSTACSDFGKRGSLKRERERNSDYRREENIKDRNYLNSWNEQELEKRVSRGVKERQEKER